MMKYNLSNIGPSVDKEQKGQESRHRNLRRMINEKIVEQGKQIIEEVIKYNLCYVAPLQGEDTIGRALRQTLALYDRKTQKREKLKK